MKQLNMRYKRTELMDRLQELYTLWRIGKQGDISPACVQYTIGEAIDRIEMLMEERG